MEKEKYPHLFHQQGRKTGIEISIEKMEKLLKTLPAKQKKQMKKNIEVMRQENEENKINGVLTIGDFEEIIKILASSKTTVGKDGSEVPFKKERRKKCYNKWKILR